MESTHSFLPAITVIIPCRNMKDDLSQLLLDLECQLVSPKTFEVLVVDDGSNSPILHQKNFSFNFRIIRLSRQGPAVARNIGASYGVDFLLFLDADVRVPPTLISQYLQAAKNSHPNVVAWSGPIYHSIEKNASCFARQLAEASFVNLKRTTEPPDILWAPSCNMMIRRRIFEEVGGYDERFIKAGGEDIALCLEMRCRNYQLDWVSGAKVYHRNDKYGKDVISRCFRYGRGEAGLIWFRYVGSRPNTALLIHFFQLISFFFVFLLSFLEINKALWCWLLILLILFHKSSWAKELSSIAYQLGFWRDLRHFKIWEASDMELMIGENAMKAIRINEKKRATNWVFLALYLAINFLSLD